ncbi:MAG: hypothetical protein AB1552_12390 [Nitrospirota bacterium]
MNNSDWLWWFFAAYPSWTAPVRLVVFALVGFGFIIIGITGKNWRNILWGTVVIIFVVFLCRNDNRNLLEGFTHLNLLAVKIFYGVLICIIAIILMIAFKIIKASNGKT